MSRWHNLSEVAAMFAGPYARDRRYFTKVYERLQKAIYLRECGRVQRLGRGWLLTETNVQKLVKYMRKRWGMEPLPAEAPEQNVAV